MFTSPEAISGVCNALLCTRNPPSGVFDQIAWIVGYHFINYYLCCVKRKSAFKQLQTVQIHIILQREEQRPEWYFACAKYHSGLCSPFTFCSTPLILMHRLIRTFTVCICPKTGFCRAWSILCFVLMELLIWMSNIFYSVHFYFQVHKPWVPLYPDMSWVGRDFSITPM